MSNGKLALDSKTVPVWKCLYSKKSSILIFIAFLVGYCAMLYCLGKVLLYHHNLFYFLTPDISTYPSLAHNILFQHGHLWDWHIGAAPYIFPEITFFYIFSLFSTSSFASLLTYMVLQTTL